MMKFYSSLLSRCGEGHIKSPQLNITENRVKGGLISGSSAKDGLGEISTDKSSLELLGSHSKSPCILG